MKSSVEPDLQTAKLKLVRLGIDTYRENVAYLHRDCEVYRAEGFQALSKVTVCADGRRILAVLNVVDDAAIVAPDELALSEEAFDHLGLPKGQWVTVDHAQPPASMDAVRRKIAGQRLDQEDFRAIIQDITES